VFEIPNLNPVSR